MPCTILSQCRLAQVMLANLVSSTKGGERSSNIAHRHRRVPPRRLVGSGTLRGAPPFAVTRLPESACAWLVGLYAIGRLRASGLLYMGRSGVDNPTAGRCGMLFVTDVQSEQLLFAGITSTHARPLLSQAFSGACCRPRCSGCSYRGRRCPRQLGV